MFYKISEVVGYASEFKNQDEFAVKSLDTFIKNADSSCVMSKAMKDSMEEYKRRWKQILLHILRTII